ncbi:MAG TPA: flagellar motor protein MotB [Candidatus Hydrogenedentes bacterium]|nr:flagellar motor protein MotB [Candidatus Hydrogenedentota bacterium]HOS02459.1 flagellar motor protein MotB [Candidatus Hydrogenedentota bacterium]
MARLVNRPHPRIKEPSAPPWIVTYADMMSLLLAFFILLVAFSAIDLQKARDALKSVQEALGTGALFRESSPEGASSNGSQAPLDGNTVERAARQLRQRLQILGKAEDVRIDLDEQGGLRIALPSRALFDSASAELRPDAFDALRAVGELLAGLPQADIQVAGHTDNRPLKNSPIYRDNYDLSFARAMGVCRFLSERAGVPLTQLEVVAYGPNKPVATNETDEGRQANRRVEIYISGRLSNREVETIRGQAGTMEQPATITAEGP